MRYARYIFAKVAMTISLAASAAGVVLSLFPGVLGPKVGTVPLLVASALALAAGVFFGVAYRNEKAAVVYDRFGRKRRSGKFFQSSLERHAQDAASAAELERILPTNALESATHRAPARPLEELERLVGLEPVKERVREIAARAAFDASSPRSLRSARGELKHMVFYGAPGTGKTTVARIMAGVLYDCGLVSRNACVEVDGNFLKSSDPASTSTKVRLVCEGARGGVLFVDEAYALAKKGDPLGEAALATLVKEMEDNRDALVVVLAGYSDEMKKMLDVNPGLRTRIKDYVFFPDYSGPDLIDLAVVMAGQRGLVLSEGAAEAISSRLSKERGTPSWGNARSVRNIVEESIGRHALNLETGVVGPESRYVLEREDVPAARGTL